MKAWLLNVGNEVLEGKVINTNASYLASELLKLGIIVSKVIVVGDYKNDINNTIDEFYQSDCDILITTGGLGPTHDDFTKEVICEKLNVELIKNEIASIDMFNYFGQVKDDCNAKQTYFPQDAIILRNKIGTADGFILEHNNKMVVSLVGPNYELIPMVEDGLVPYLKDKGITPFIQEFITMGNSESYFEELLKELIFKYNDVNLAPYASNGIVRFQITSYNKENFNNCINDFKDIMGDYIVSEKNESIEEVIVHELIDKKLTISFAESCTGGMLASTIINVNGASNIIKESFVTYSNESKIKYLNVKKETIDNYGVCSCEVVNEMAKGLYQLNFSDICVSVSGYASGERSGEIYYAIKYKDTLISEFKKFGGSRNMVRIRATRWILYKTLLMIRG